MSMRKNLNVIVVASRNGQKRAQVYEISPIYDFVYYIKDAELMWIVRSKKAAKKEAAEWNQQFAEEG